MIWIKVKDFPHLWVSEAGDVISFRRKEAYVMKPYNSTKGYLQIDIKNVNKRHRLTVHRLIAVAFISNPDNLPQVNHLDGDKTNNKVTNLEWCTGSHNMKHGFKQGLLVSPNKGKFGKDNHLSKAINQFTLDGKFVKRWECGMALKRAGFHNVTRCCQGKKKSDKGFVWQYADK